jgi:hypothetical protein
MTEPGQKYSDFVEILRRHGEFRKNWGVLIGAVLYLRSLSAVRSRSFSWADLILGLIAAALPWAAKLDWRWP